MPHVILLGDSILDNASYTSGGPDVVSQVRGLLPAGWTASLLAVDGSVTDNISEQTQRVPNGATHLVLSVGGNDALMNASLLGISLFGLPPASTRNSNESLVEVRENFATRYRLAVDSCMRPGLPLAVCTIYNGCFPDHAYQRLASLGLALFNDVIISVAIERSLPIIDLRIICVDSQDYANPIEPSSTGGEKIARAIVATVAGNSAAAYRTVVFT
jgi:hypothetical protein